MPHDAKSKQRQPRRNAQKKLALGPSRETAVHAWAQQHVAGLPKEMPAWDASRTTVYLSLRELLMKELGVTRRLPKVERLCCLRLRIEALQAATMDHVHLLLFVPVSTLTLPNLLKANRHLIQDQELQSAARQLSYSPSTIHKTACRLP